MQQLILSGVPYTQLLDDLRSLIRSEVQNAPASAPTSAAEPDQLLSVREAAQLLDVCSQTIHEWKRRGLLKFHKLSGRTYLKRTDVLAALQGQQRTTKKGRAAK
ncbi:helix-turn-helix domain-containing protein [Hymenobacter cheonanensis]|uniref:helix-turn-helix domain-containing protein n=1 Tax=Hymenobacter sp. CA2-7 TaxID=3063993 RepID=UPI00271306C1|nr:helix-turn-helix domain-containing protein [Hymenobacter sp. CA2-7]MDO7884236.1 helix-turn-helix domain-containing protein [Hymenobacter sp. CA2-7]